MKLTESYKSRIKQLAGIITENNSELNDNFHKWFQGSKVVNKDGTPMIVHHGTSKKFSKFNFKNAPQQIIWFTSNKASVEAGEVGAQGKGHVMDLYAQIRHPAGWDEYDKYGLGQLEEMGFDGAILPDPDGSITGFVFESNQLKSVANKGEWSNDSGNIFKENNAINPNRKEIEILKKKVKEYDDWFGNNNMSSRRYSEEKWNEKSEEQKKMFRRLIELTGDPYGETKEDKQKQRAKPSDALLNAKYNYPSELPKEVYNYIRLHGNILTDDASDAVRFSRIIDTENDERYPRGEMTIYRAVENGGEIRAGDWVTPKRNYAEEHNRKYFDGRGKILEMDVDGRDVLVSPTGDYEEAIYAPLELSEPINESTFLQESNIAELEYNTKNNVDISAPIQYHGTTKERAAKIRKEGFYPQYNVNLTDDISEAEEYADYIAESENTKPEILKVRLKKGARPVSRKSALDEMAFNPKYVVLDYSEIHKKSINESIIRKLIRKIISEGIHVYHGSDRKFDAFNMDKVGSGDGKQLGGWGLYFSDSEDVSKRYVTSNGFLKQYEIREGNYFNLDESLDEGVGNDIISKLKNLDVPEDELEQFQSDFINYIPDITNKQVYEWLSYVLKSEKAASLFLESLGYVGTKFQDKWESSATNYVIFNPKNVKE